MLLKLRKTIFKFILAKDHVYCLFIFKISQTASQYQNTTNCLYLHGSYISKFDFMNYLFANMVVAWL